MKIAIIADDLTGANDTGVQLAMKGISTAVRLEFEGGGALPPYEAIVFDTDSRSDSGAEAYRKVKAASLAIRAERPETVYKKIDSTIRGNIGPELDALYDVFRPDFVAIAPSFPRNGRTVREGVMHIDGVPLHLTEAARDPKTPVSESYLPHLLASQTRRSVGLVTLGEVRRGSRHLVHCIQRLLEQGIVYALFDAETDDDLRRVADALRESRLRTIWCGSAGLAQALYPDAPETSRQSPPQIAAAASSPVLIVVGSVNAKTRRQLRKLLQNSEVAGLEMRADQALTPEGRSAEIQRLLLQFEQTVRHSRYLALYTSGSSSDIAHAQACGSRLGMNDKEVSDAISETLGQLAALLIDRNRVKYTVLTGGDTAKQVCIHLGSQELELLDEVESGAPLCRLSAGHELYAITKAGGFGDEMALLRLMNFYRGGEAKWNRSLG